MKSKDYDVLADQIVGKIGGSENVVSLTHCVTRLRFKLKNDERANKKAIEKLDGVLSVVEGNGQFQVVIGPEVESAYAAVVKKYPAIAAAAPKSGSQDSENTAPSGNALIRVMNTMAAIINPIVPALAGAGMVKALLVILSNTLGWLDNASSTYLILAAASNSVFYFLPLFLAYTASKTFGANPFISLAIVGALLEPNFTGMITSNGARGAFLGIPVVLVSYTSSLIPALLVVYVYSKLEKLLKRFIPKSIELFALSFVALLIMVPLSAIVIGPISVSLANGMAAAVNFLSTKSGIVSGALLGGGWTFLVMFGIHWGIVPIMLNNFSTFGFDYIRPTIAAATFASAGAALGVFLRSREKKTKAFALSAMTPALLGGITEPIVYGISLKYKRPFIAQTIAGIVGGGFIGMMQTKAIAYVFPAITTLPAFFGDTFIYYVIGISIAFFGSAALTFILGFEESETDGGEEATRGLSGDLALSACVEGKAVPLTSVADKAFASKSVGDGVAIVPNHGIVYAPSDATVSMVFDTKHALILKTDEGVDVMIHIGINTVELGGKGFESLVSSGDRVRKGDVLVKFDLDAIQKAGYDATTMMLILDAGESVSVEMSKQGPVTTDNQVMTVRRK